MKTNLTQLICKSSVLAVFALAAVSAYSQNFIVGEGAAVRVYDPSKPVGSQATTFATTNNAVDVVVGGAHVFVSDYGASTVRRYSTTGADQGVMDGTSAGGGFGSAGLAFLNNRVHASFFNVRVVGAIRPDAALTEDGNRNTPDPYLNFSTGGSYVHGMTPGMNGATDIVYYTGRSGTQLIGTDAYLAEWRPGFSQRILLNLGLTTVRGVVSAANDTFYVAMYDLDKVIKITYNGTEYVQSDFITGIDTPVGVEIDGNNLYVSSFAGKTITGYDLGTASNVSTFTTEGSPQYFSVTAIPEPSTHAMFGLAGVAGFITMRRRSKVV